MTVTFLLALLCMLVCILQMVQSFAPGYGSQVLRRGLMEMRERKCDIAGTRKNSKAMSVSKSNAHTHRTQEVNLQWRRLFWEEGNKYVRIRVSARTLKTIKLKGLNAVAKDHGINLNRFAISSGTGKPATV